MTEPIRVHVFGARTPGGVETFVLNVYRAIDTTRVQFDFALTQGVKSLFDDEVLARGGRIYYFDQHRSMQQNLAHVLKTGGPFAAVHSHVYFYSGVVVTIARAHGVPVRIAHAHNTSFGQVYTLKRRVYEWLMRKLIWRNATQLLGCSTDACEFVFGPGCMDDPVAGCCTTALMWITSGSMRTDALPFGNNTVWKNASLSVMSAVLRSRRTTVSLLSSLRRSVRGDRTLCCCVLAAAALWTKSVPRVRHSEYRIA